MRNAVPSDDTIDVWWFDTRAVAVTPAGLAGLDRGELGRAGSFLFPVDRHRYQVAHAMLRQVLAGYTGTAPGRLRLDREPCPRCGAPGKPVLRPGPGARAAPSFSLSHAGDMVVIAVAAHPVGVDVEQDADRCVCPLAGDLHPADAAWVAGLGGERERHRAILTCWVRAEAVLKCTGEGIGHGLAGLPVRPGRSGDLSVSGCTVRQLAAPPGYRAAAAWRAAGVRPRFVRANGRDGSRFGTQARPACHGAAWVISAQAGKAARRWT
jgi:4'-phosphopantetheinyl transferase